MDLSFPVAGCEQPLEMLDQPLEMLGGCHERIRTRCVLVERIAAQLVTRLPDAEMREAAHSVVRFFDTAADAHHCDEEEDLFPALIASVPREDLEATRLLVARLGADHVRLGALWRDMRRQLVLLAAVGARSLTQTHAAEFRQAYERHIAIEESEVLPLAQRVLGATSVAAIGAHMAQRRGVRRVTA